ncbi:hypothetical protein ElyMa_005029500 [Elysia marginata]|uniref:Uncharacterized protein n=1 Tax=Elysia marginata TaxID=1093978 RepID=A0AAV4JAB5_9GAST|nr:hypothetical protein ElyMa_005029500 [Elysia marginata]
MAPYRCKHKLYEDYYGQQVGTGLPVFQGSRDQRGYGLGSLLSGLGRMIVPLLKRGGKALVKEGLNTGLDIARNVVAGNNIKTAERNRVRQAGRNLMGKAIGSASRKRKVSPVKAQSRPSKSRKRVHHFNDIFN